MAGLDSNTTLNVKKSCFVILNDIRFLCLPGAPYLILDDDLDHAISVATFRVATFREKVAKFVVGPDAGLRRHSERGPMLQFRQWQYFQKMEHFDSNDIIFFFNKKLPPLAGFDLTTYSFQSPRWQAD
jgi:hypothetical protein